MPSHPVTLANGLVARIQSIECTRQAVESLLASKLLRLRDVETLYAGLFANAVMTMEGFLEDLFLGLLSGGVSSRRTHPRSTFRRRSTAMEFVLQGDDYVEWLPFHRTLGRAKIFFRKGRPFTELPGHLQDNLRKASLIRNALVHSSRFARDQFADKVIGATPLAPRERGPVGFLRSVFRVTPVQRRFEIYVMAIADSARFLAQNS